MSHSFIKRIIRFFAPCFRLFPLNVIVFESIPDFSDNSKAVFDEMIRRKLNKKFKMVWVYCQHRTRLEIPNTKVLTKNDHLSFLYYTLRAKCIISCNNYIETWGEYQKSIYLAHGVALKSMNRFVAPKQIDFITGPSEEANKIMSKAIKFPLSKFLVTGYPRNDALNKTSFSIHKYFDNKYERIVVWYPTFRQHIGSNIDEGAVKPLPIIHNKKLAIAINSYAKNNRILIILKPHFSQDLSYIQDSDLSNIHFINDGFFTENKITSYDLVGSCDALITDYSSIYFDYLLCNKPVAAVWEDIDEYKKNRGFCIDVDYYMKGAYKIYNFDDFLLFLDEVLKGIDSKKTERDEINLLINKFHDSRSAERVVNFIENRLLYS